MASRRFPEHSLQVQVRKWVKECVAIDYEFFAFDRSKAHSQMTHFFEKARGIQAGTPDTLLMPGEGYLNVWCELKAGKNKPSEIQEHVGARIIKLGENWFWANSVVSYAEGVHKLGIPLCGGWLARAVARDVILAAGATKSLATSKPPTKPSPVKKPAAGRIRKTAKLRSEVLF